MALSYKVGSFAQPTSTNASFGVTGVGFVPKVVILFCNNATADGSQANAHVSIGAASSTSARFGGSIESKNGQSASSVGFDEESTIALTIANDVPTILVKADFVSFDSDGFTLNFSTVDANARIINYIAIGGADLTNANVGNASIPASTGNKSFTGIGFKPDALIFVNVTDYTVLPSSASDNVKLSIGFGLSSTARGYAANYNEKITSPSITKRKQIVTKAIGCLTSASMTWEADMVSMDADGFTLNFSTVDAGAADIFFYIALKGGQYKTGTFTQKTSTGSQATTGIGFTPTGVIFASVNNTSSSSIVNTARFSLGSGSSSTSRGCIWLGSTNGVSTTVTNSNLDRSNIIKMMTEAGTPTTQAAADLTSLDSDGWTLNWGTADATAREILYLALGSNAATIKRFQHLPLLGIG